MPKGKGSKMPLIVFFIPFSIGKPKEMNAALTKMVQG
jgi:hypothetical protein